MLQSNEAARQHHIGEGEQRKELRVVLGQAAIARLAMFEQAFHDMEVRKDGMRYCAIWRGAVQPAAIKSALLNNQINTALIISFIN